MSTRSNPTASARELPRASALLRAFVIAIAITAVSRAGESPFAVVGYLPEYRIAAVSPEKLTAVTDLIFFGIEAPADGRLPNPVVKDSILKTLREIRRKTQCRLLICVGGWNRSSGFSSLATNEAARNRFVADMSAFCRSNGFDGIDYDWEHPKHLTEMAAYGDLVTDTRTAFSKAGLLVTIAQAGWQNAGERIYRAVDRVHLMSYDHDFPQATLEKSTADVDRIIGWGCPAGKIALGVPFYGRNVKRDALSYRDLIQGNAGEPGADTINGYAFNGRRTVMNKTIFAADRKLAGIMIWELGQDSTRDKTSLLSAIGRTLHRLQTPEKRE